MPGFDHSRRQRLNPLGIGEGFELERLTLIEKLERLNPLGIGE